jgi:hypothetical protein
MSRRVHAWARNGKREKVLEEMTRIGGGGGISNSMKSSWNPPE